MYVMRTEYIYIGTVCMYKGVSLMFTKTYGEWVTLWEKKKFLMGRNMGTKEATMLYMMN